MRANAMIASRGLGGIILEHAMMDDVGDGTLHLRGSVPVFVKYDRNGMGEGDVYGLLYHQGVFYGRRGRTNESRDDDTMTARWGRTATAATMGRGGSRC